MLKELFFKKKETFEATLEKINVCKVCGKSFKLEKEKRYVVQENKGISGIASGTKKFECFDCPECGCQNILNIREG